MTALHFVTNSISSAKEMTRAGKAYLVSPVVALREGVLNEALVLQAEIEKYPESWEGRVTPVDHPQINGIYVSANLLDVVDTKVMGNFHNVQVDGDRLKGEIWIDLEKAAKLGDRAMTVVNRLRAGEPVEVSTGYFADLEETAGTWNGATYTGIHRNIRPDHLALLPDGIGACSWDDGCGTPRTNKRGNMQLNEKDLNDRAVLVRRAFWQKVWDESEGDGATGDWDVLSIFDKTLIAKDWVTQTHAAFPYTVANEGGEVTFGEPTPVDVVYRAKEGGAEVVVVNDKQVSLLARLRQWLKADKTDSVAANEQQEEENVKKCDLVAALVANKAVTVSREKLDTWNEDVLQAFHDSLKANEEAIVEAPAADPVVAPATVELPAEIIQFAEMIRSLGGVEKLGTALGSITANADSEKAVLVAELVANEQCAFDEADLKAMSTVQLQKLASSLQIRDYSGAAGVIGNGGRVQDEVLAMPKLEWAVKEDK